MPSLETLLGRSDIELVAVYTQPDRQSGRGRHVHQSPVKQCALNAGIVLEQPEKFRDEESLERYRGYAPDLLVVVAYGQILSEQALAVAPDNINVHASLLPRWRGAAPIQRAMMAGDEKSGVSIMRMVLELDAGPVWLSRELPITSNDTGETLHNKLASLGGEALDTAIDHYLASSVKETPQDSSEVTYAAKITAADRSVDLCGDCNTVSQQVRALSPRPGVEIELAGMAVKLITVSATPSIRGEPGTVTGYSSDGIELACGRGGLVISALKPAGKKIMTAADFINGYGHKL